MAETPRSFILGCYRLGMSLARPLAGPLLDWRTRRGKEDPARRGERFGVAGRPRPPGPLIWLHAASVGEVASILPLIERLSADYPVSILLTTGTVTSTRIVEARMPGPAIHQYLPLDSPSFVARFLDHWRPDMAVLAESELWPNMIRQTSARGTPLVLVNARMSERSFRRWGGARRMIRTLLRHFDLCLAQSEGDAERLAALGAPTVVHTGNLKFDAPAPAVAGPDLDSLRVALEDRPRWAAVSVHLDEVEPALSAHQAIAAGAPDLLTILVPRHPERGPAVAELAAARGLAVALRTRDGVPGRHAAVFVLDTIGETGLAFASTQIVFMGRSLVPQGGSNPIEAAKLACAILHGPHVDNFAEVYAGLDAGGATRAVRSSDELAQTVANLLADPQATARLVAAGGRAIEPFGGALDRTVSALDPMIRVICEGR